MLASIIIPTRNRSSELAETLKSISNQTVLSNVEIIVVDNGSTDDTAKIVKEFGSIIPSLVYEYNAIPGLLTGRHRGAEIAVGEVLCSLDDDVKINPDYVKNLLSAFSEDASLHLATGPCLPNYEIAPPDWLHYFWEKMPEGKYCTWLSLLGLGDKQIEVNPNFIWGLNFCIRKKTLIDLGGFHPDCIPESLQQYQGDGETGLTLKAIYTMPKKVTYPKEVTNLITVLDNCDREGYSFHQNCFKTNEKVRDWVLKKDYWDYQLPK